MLNKSDHGFRYYTSDNRGGPTGGPRTNTQPGPARKAAEAAAAAAGSRDGGGLQRSGRPGSSRVRVAAGAGDKCVPPAKSKPKKRKAVREGEGPSIGMECVDWSEEMYSVGQLVSAFGHRLPVIAKVCAGCSDDFGTALQVDQVLQVHSFGRQRRIKARYVKGRGGKLSIPLDYPMEIYTKEGSTGERWKLMQAMEVKRLPLKAQVLSTHGAEDNVHLAGEELELKRVEEEVFLRANHIHDGWIDQSNVVLIPANAAAQFCIAIGMRNASGSELDDYFGMFARSVRHLRFEMLTGYPGVIMEDALASARSSIAQLSPQVSTEPASAPAVYANVAEVKQIDKEKVAEPPLNVYENLPKEDKKAIVEHYRVNDMTYAQVKQRPSEKNKPETLPPLVNAPSGHLRPDLQSPRPETPFSEIDGEDLQEMFLSVVSLVEEQDKLEEKRQRSLQRGEATEHRVVVETHQIPVGQQSYLNAAFQPDDGAAEKPRQKKIPPKVEKKPSKSSKQQQKVDYKNVRNQFEARKGSGSSEEQSGRIVVNRKNDHPPPRAVVQPTMKESPSPLVTGNIVQVTITENDLVDRRASTVSVSKIEAIEDVPEDLDGLTVSDVCQCLRLLNMDSHVKHFQKHQVDGGLLADMKEKVLTDEFKFTPFNASKLMRFARGWRPKLV